MQFIAFNPVSRHGSTHSAGRVASKRSTLCDVIQLFRWKGAAVDLPGLALGVGWMRSDLTAGSLPVHFSSTQFYMPGHSGIRRMPAHAKPICTDSSSIKSSKPMLAWGGGNEGGDRSENRDRPRASSLRCGPVGPPREACGSRHEVSGQEIPHLKIIGIAFDEWPRLRGTLDWILTD